MNIKDKNWSKFFWVSCEWKIRISEKTDDFSQFRYRVEGVNRFAITTVGCGRSLEEAYANCFTWPENNAREFFLEG